MCRLADLYLLSDLFESAGVTRSAARLTHHLLSSSTSSSSSSLSPPRVWVFCQSDRAQRDVYVQELKRLLLLKKQSIYGEKSDHAAIDNNHNGNSDADDDDNNPFAFFSYNLQWQPIASFLPSTTTSSRNIMAHDKGFCMWNSTTIPSTWNWNVVDIGPRRDLVGDFASALQNFSSMETI